MPVLTAERSVRDRRLRRSHVDAKRGQTRFGLGAFNGQLYAQWRRYWKADPKKTLKRKPVRKLCRADFVTSQNLCCMCANRLPYHQVLQVQNPYHQICVCQGFPRLDRSLIPPYWYVQRRMKYDRTDLLNFELRSFEEYFLPSADFMEVATLHNCWARHSRRRVHEARLMLISKRRRFMFMSLIMQYSVFLAGLERSNNPRSYS